MACITGYWASSVQIKCPLCMKKFRRRPQLLVNTGFRDMVEHFKSISERDEEVIRVKPGEVPCDICLVPKLKAEKSCVVCFASYCQLHLEPHQRVAPLKKHQLIDPMSDLEERVCKRHDKMLELFCREDQTCVCLMCLKDDHAAHDAVPLELAVRERRGQLACVTSEMNEKENSRSRSIKEIKHSADQSRKASEKDIADIADVFTALVVSRERHQDELIEVIRKKQENLQKTAEDHVTQLELEVAELRRRRSEMEQLLQTEDHLLLLQSCPSLLPAQTEDIFSNGYYSMPTSTSDLLGLSQQSYVATVKKAAAQMEKSLSNEMDMLIHTVKLDCCDVEMPEGFATAWIPPRDKLMMIQQNEAVDVKLDTYTARYSLIVSEDGKQLSFGPGPPYLIDWFRKTFQLQDYVLGKEGFSSGRFYYEVDVSKSRVWVLGVAKESVQKWFLTTTSPEEGCWTLRGSYDRCQSYFPQTWMNVRLQRPQTVGVFVDYVKGEVSFYDVDARALIYSYSGCAFIENIPPWKSFLEYLVGASVSRKAKIYPFFGIFNDNFDNTLVITPVAQPT
ncbi:E3 ubiquitin-protein ligase TRIM21 [Liparis tanakae]|uniref:E3 ubiquitin-protein ligase TRIM21 n=1 Tax=Liparis tanakae TaxID=230148 RepID=A0A4Z2GJT0_9TELE|nr:E3 ubiquitin-protein ligase TRIM21 [Liparis tanakae]